MKTSVCKYDPSYDRQYTAPFTDYFLAKISGLAQGCFMSSKFEHISIIESFLYTFSNTHSGKLVKCPTWLY